MTLYILKFSDDDAGVGKRIEFDAANAGKALIVIAGEAPNRTAELWEGSRRICTIRRSETAAWSIGP